ncbi:unnamed protein product [Spodoptera littoralis]|uniref:Uncharacterized protein n=1 Tax=Spodoptera littoralis TaxID=7109 RepID=A0A9P0II31_SPOLI|nr:unnamed protein product [Spodoptera littoralis]CAH1647746.1 unnamed protein product [Spodoptera littoralis]
MNLTERDIVRDSKLNHQLTVILAVLSCLHFIFHQHLFCLNLFHTAIIVKVFYLTKLSDRKLQS